VTAGTAAPATGPETMPRLDDLCRADVPFRTGHFQAYAPHDFHRIAYVEWGDPDSPHVVVCVHGLSRQGRDFDALGYRLAKLGYRVICPDLPGRGLSGWLKDPELYGLPQYAADMAALIYAAEPDAEKSYSENEAYSCGGAYS